jgi:uncharacterized protein YbbC (DUF1343 family)
MKKIFSAFILFFLLQLSAVEVGLEVFFKEGQEAILQGKRVGLITNHTAVDKELKSSIDLFKERALEYKLTALFAPEHGLEGLSYAGEKIEDRKDASGIPIFSLHGKSRRPSEEMLKDIDILVYDVQDIGIRSYTYASTLFYVMEEAGKRKIPVLVLDRPNPINGLIVDGPMLSSEWRSFVGYINVPYCHGMTIGELARFFNEEYRIGCELTVIAMKGWKRSMTFKDTQLPWIPLSPMIPESTTPLYYASTGILGELSIVNIGIGYTLPFKVVGADWIDAGVFAEKLNAQKLPGVHFTPFHYRPFFGSFKGKDCHGVMIIIKDLKTYRPLAVQYLLIGMLKSLYPDNVQKSLDAVDAAKEKFFCQINGNSEIFKIMKNERYIAWKLIEYQKTERELFLALRQKYLLGTYSED